MQHDDASPVLVLASRRSFEGLVGPTPASLVSNFRFLKPSQVARIEAILPSCSLVVSKSYPRPDLNRWILAARRRRIPTMLVIDGPLEWANLHRNPSLARRGVGSLFEPIVHDVVVTIGDAQAAWIAHRNRGRGIQFMSYRNHRIVKPPRDESIVPEFDFLLTTAKTPHFDERERSDLIAALEACGAALESRGAPTLVRLFDPELRARVEAVLPSGRFDTRGDFSDAAVRSRCVIGTPSSVILESMTLGRPTGILMFRDAPLLYQSGWLLGEHTDWEASISSMLAPSPARMALQEQTLLENVSRQDFFSELESRLLADEPLEPRPLDTEDLVFENAALHRLLGWRGRLLAPLLRRITSRSR